MYGISRQGLKVACFGALLELVTHFMHFLFIHFNVCLLVLYKYKEEGQKYKEENEKDENKKRKRKKEIEFYIKDCSFFSFLLFILSLPFLSYPFL